jgi:putative phosphoesterase
MEVGLIPFPQPQKSTINWSEYAMFASMKKIGLISDTHGWLDPRVFHHFDAVDEIWHAGDFGEGVLEALRPFKPFRGVWGNIDGSQVRQHTQEHLRFQCEEVDVWMTHIAGKPGNYAKPIAQDLQANPPKILVCGHSHICLVKFDPILGTLYMNPGAAGRHGFHHMRTLLRFEIDGPKIQKLEVIELGPRTEKVKD